MPKKQLKIKPQNENLVRIIRKTSDAGLDYFIPKERAKELHAQGKLSQANVYSGRWDYITNNENEHPR